MNPSQLMFQRATALDFGIKRNNIHFSIIATFWSPSELDIRPYEEAFVGIPLRNKLLQKVHSTLQLKMRSGKRLFFGDSL
jgi:hypothetical protein